MRIFLRQLVILALAIGCVASFPGCERSDSREDRTLQAITDSPYDHHLPALHSAVWNGKTRKLQRLLESGVDPGQVHAGVLAETPLHLAAVANRAKAAELLLKHGADVNARSAHLGVTPLYLASVAGNTQMVELLKKHGADETIANVYGATPSQAAAFLKAGESRPLEKIEPGGDQPVDPRSVVRILWLGFREGEYFTSGSALGFVIESQQRIVTAAHCVAQKREIEKKGYLTRPIVLSAFHGDLFEASIEYVDEASDIAVLHVDWPAHVGLELASTEEISSAEEVRIVGHESSKLWAGSPEAVMAASAERLPLWQFDPDAGYHALVMAPRQFVGPGWSGSPIVTVHTGHVAGVFARRELWQYGKHVVHYSLFGGSAEALRPVLSGNKPVATAAAAPDAARACRILVDMLNNLTGDDQKARQRIRDEALAIRPKSSMVRLMATFLHDPSDEGYPQLMDRDTELAVELQPDSVLAHGRRGIYLKSRGRNEEAMSHFDRALEIAPDTVACRLEKARLVGKHDLEAAKQVLREAGDLNPSLLFELGLILKKQQRSEESLQAFRKACAAFPDYKEMPHAWMRYLADALRDDASYEESEKWYRRLLEVHECFRCWMAYATLLEKLGSDRRDDALKAIEKAEAHDENSEDERERAKALRATMNAENGAEVSAGG